jgi:putative transcriptional regulator
MSLTPLRKLRRSLGLSLETVAQGVGSDTGNLSRIETGEQVAGHVLAERLCKFYGTGITELHIIYPERYVDYMTTCAPFTDSAISAGISQ